MKHYLMSPAKALRLMPGVIGLVIVGGIIWENKRFLRGLFNRLNQDDALSGNVAETPFFWKSVKFRFMHFRYRPRAPSQISMIGSTRLSPARGRALIAPVLQ
jgi:hypothetical protein